MNSLLFALAFGFGITAPLDAWATPTCGPIECYDPCSKSKISLDGDRCNLTWDAARKCYTAYTECKDSKKCLGAVCYDDCDDKDRYFPKANTCKEALDSSASCWRAYATCE